MNYKNLMYYINTCINLFHYNIATQFILKYEIYLLIHSLGTVQKLHHPATREGGVSKKMILDYVGGGRGLTKDDG